MIRVIFYFAHKLMIQGPTGSRTRIEGFKVPSDNHYTIRPCFVSLKSLCLSYHFVFLTLIFGPALRFTYESGS
jgi:hypothetical protein